MEIRGDKQSLIVDPTEAFGGGYRERSFGIDAMRPNGDG